MMQLSPALKNVHTLQLPVKTGYRDRNYLRMPSFAMMAR